MYLAFTPNFLKLRFLEKERIKCGVVCMAFNHLSDFKE